MPLDQSAKKVECVLWEHPGGAAKVRWFSPSFVSQSRLHLYVQWKGKRSPQKIEPEIVCKNRGDAEAIKTAVRWVESRLKNTPTLTSSGLVSSESEVLVSSAFSLYEQLGSYGVKNKFPLIAARFKRFAGDRFKSMTIADVDPVLISNLIDWLGKQRHSKTDDLLSVSTIEHDVTLVCAALNAAQKARLYVDQDGQRRSIQLCRSFRKFGLDRKAGLDVEQLLGRRKTPAQKQVIGVDGWATFFNSLDLSKRTQRAIFRICLTGLQTMARPLHILQTDWRSSDKNGAVQINVEGFEGVHAVDLNDVDPGLRSTTKVRALVRISDGFRRQLREWNTSSPWPLANRYGREIDPRDLHRTVGSSIKWHAMKAGFPSVVSSLPRHEMNTFVRSRLRISKEALLEVMGHDGSVNARHYTHVSPTWQREVLDARQEFVADLADRCDHRIYV